MNLMNKRLIKYFYKKLENRGWKKKVLISKIAPLLYRENNGSYVIDEDWDNLIILDACRYDTFKEIIERDDIEGKLEYKISRGSNTSEFLLENFGNGEFKDIVYIAANPFVTKLLKGKFHSIIQLWKSTWSEEYFTVLPKYVYNKAIKTKLKYPNKRLIVHFNQPHRPYIHLLDMGVNDFGLVGVGSDGVNYIYNADKKVIPIIKQAYKDNLRAVMPYALKLANNLSGKTVITSDHGEAFGEKLHPLVPLEVYLHPAGVRIEPLVKVPWFIRK